MNRNPTAQGETCFSFTDAQRRKLVDVPHSRSVGVEGNGVGEKELGSTAEVANAVWCYRLL